MLVNTHGQQRHMVNYSAWSTSTHGQQQHMVNITYTPLLPFSHTGFVPVLIRVLFPSLRKRTGRLAGKGAPGSARAAVLNYLAGAQAEELSTLLELFLRPMSGCFVQKPCVQKPCVGSEAAGGGVDGVDGDEGYVVMMCGNQLCCVL